MGVKNVSTVLLIALVVAALVPAVVLCVYVWKKDRVEKEPIGLLLLLLLLGAVSCIPVIIVEVGFNKLWDAIFIPIVGTTSESTALAFQPGTLPFYVHCFLDNFIGVALVEEGFKFLFLFLATRKNKNFNSLFDGMIYAIFVSLGFAALENILYVTDNGFYVAAMRAVLSVPGHMFFAVLMGYYYSTWNIQKKVCLLERNAKAQGLIPANIPEKKSAGSLGLSLLLPVLAHGFYDFCLCVDLGIAVLVVLAFVIFLYIFCFRRISKMSAADGYVGEYVQSVFAMKHPGVLAKMSEEASEDKI